MTNLLKAMIYDAVFFTCFYIVFYRLEYFAIAEQVIIIFFWMFAVSGCIALTFTDDFLLKIAKKNPLKTYETVSYYRFYLSIASFFKVVGLITIGMNWLAIFYLIGSLGIRGFTDDLNRIRKQIRDDAS